MIFKKESKEFGLKIVGLSLLFYALGEYNFLLGRAVVEGWSMVVAWSIYSFSAASYGYSRNSTLLLLGYAYLVAGSLDFFRLLAWKGVGILPLEGPFVMMQLRLAARYVEIFSIVAALLLRNRRLSPLIVAFFYGVLFLLLSASILVHPLFPSVFTSSGEWTSFGLFSENFLVLVLAGGLGVLFLYRKELRGISLLPFAAALLFSIMGEMCFTLCPRFFASENLMGPLFKGLSFYSLFQSVLVTGVFEPYEKMEKSRDTTFRLLHNLPVPLWQSDEGGVRFFWNRAWLSLLGSPSEETSGPSKESLSWEERIHPEDRKRYLHAYEKAMTEKKDFSLSYRIQDNRGRWRTLVDSAVPLLEESERGFWGISYDLTSLQEALEQVKSKEREWRSLAKSLPDGLFRVNSEGRLLFVNSWGLEMFGISRPILVLGKLLRETCLPASFRALEEEHFQPYFQKVRDLPDNPISLRDRGRYYEVRIVSDENEWGESSGVLCIVRDVTSRYLGEYEREKLLRSMHRFSIILENTSDLVCIITSRGEIEYLNSSGIHLLAWRAHWPPRRLEDIYAASEVTSLLQEGEALLAGMCIHPRERLLRTMDGEDLPASQVMVPIHMEGDSPRFGILARDIREQRRFEKELEYQKRLLQRLVDSIPMGVFLKDPSREFRYIFWNSRMEEITGISKEKILGETDSDHFDPEVARYLREQDQEVLESGKPLIREEVRLFLEDREHLVRLIKLPLLDPEESRKLQLVLGVLEDITEEKAMEAQLFQSQKMEAVGRLAGGIAHDLNNMLQIIHGYAELLMQNPPEEREKIEFFGSSIYNGCERAREFIEQLLVFHRKGAYRLERVSLNSLVRDMTDMLEHVLPEGISLCFSPGDDLPDILADPGQIRQVVMNLCVNARDALGENGEIRVSTAFLEEGTLPVKFSLENPEGPYVVLSVCDNGPGMSREVQEKIFEPFYSTKERGKGNGLGLSIVYAVAMRHKGYVEVESEPGRGSTFHVFLPLRKEAGLVVQGKTPSPGEPESASGAPLSQKERARVTILFAEDDEVVRNFSRELLLSWGYRVIMAKNGREAVDLFSLLHDRIDALVFDVMMPEMNGIDAYRALGREGSSPPVLFCTAFMDTGLPEDLKEKKGVFFLKKPFSVEDFRRKVQELLAACGTYGGDRVAETPEKGFRENVSGG